MLYYGVCQFAVHIYKGREIHKRILNQNKTVHETNTKLIQIHRIVINTC